MFGGLEVKSKDSSISGDSSAPAAAAPASSFSFLNGGSESSAVTATDAESAQPPAAASTASAVSSFSFLNSGATDGAATVAGGQSGFSFLSSAAAEDAAPGSSNAANASDSSAIQEQPAAIASAASGFSFLGEPAAAADASPAKSPSSSPADPVVASAAAAVAASDLLATTNASLPAGAGISWSAPPINASKKPIKKKTGKTRVGISNTSAASLASLPPPSPHQHPPVGPPAVPVPPSPQSPPLKVKAEAVHNSAEEFMRQKQRSAIALAAERAMQDRSDGSLSQAANSQATPPTEVASKASSWKLANDDAYAAATLSSVPSTQTPSSPTNDETYRAAKAAAEEARKMESSPNPVAKKFTLSGLFHRKSDSVASRQEMNSYSSHGGVVVGRANSNASNADGNGSGHGVASLPPTQEEREVHLTNETHAAMAARAEEEEQRRLQAAAEQQRMQERQAEAERQQQQQENARLEEEAKRRTPREKMHHILSAFESSTKSSTQLLSQLRSQYSKLSQDRIVAETNLLKAQQQIAHATKLQSKAAEEEDFESADALGAVIEGHAREETEQCEIGKKIRDAMERIEREKKEAVLGVAGCFNNVYERLKELKVEEEGRRKMDGTDVLDKFAATSKRLSNETDRLNNDLKHIERDEELVADERKELEDQIAEGTKEFEEKCVVAREKLEVVNKKIEDLKKQLMEAEAEAATLNTELSTHKASIDSVRSKFSRQLTRLEKKQRSVKESRVEWESEKSSIEKEKTAHEAVVQAHSEDLLTMDQLLKDIQSELSVAKNFEDIISQQFDETSTPDGEDFGALDSDVLKHEAAVEEADRNLQSAEAAIQSLREEVASIEVRLPILEAEKKAAASKRDFKAAGKASKEIKDALARKEQCEAELLDEALARKEDAKEELSKTVALLDEQKSIAAEKGRELGLKRMSVLRDKICGLKSILKDFAAKDDSVSVASVGAFVIENQIRVLEASGEALGAKYGGWDDTSKPEVAEDDTVQSAPTFDSANEDEGTPAKAITSDILEQYAALKDETSKLEAAIDKAAEEEDYETAGELEEKLESVRAGVEALGISSDALDEALVNGIDENDAQAQQDVSDRKAAADDSDAQLNCNQDPDAGTMTCKAADEEAVHDIEDEKKVSDESVPNESSESPEDAAVENED